MIRSSASLIVIAAGVPLVSFDSASAACLIASSCLIVSSAFFPATQFERAPIPHAAGEVQLYFVDSIRPGRLVNSLALGKVRKLQLSAFKTLVDRNYQPNRHDLRILVVHHPVHYPPPRPRVQMSMTNDRTVAKELDIPSAAGAYPLAHLVLSGHTHFLFPQHEKLPPRPRKRAFAA